ncbi:MAG TPA: glucose-1-phosphate thymidylyltransferase [Thermoplasmata archaeon]|nr:glucose-1-phosphate thymidylyltransferase [Thermoplasmata archaeon]
MKGLILAGGHGTRLRPLTFTGNKHMIPIANQPILFYGLRHLADAGIRDVAVILGPIQEGIQEAVGDGSPFGLRVTYIVQGDPKGLAHAVACARSFLGDDPFVMYLGDNLLQQGVRAFVRRYEIDRPDAVIGATPVPEPRHYGVVELDGERIVSIEEKPRQPKSDLALIGVYLFTPAIHEIIARLRPSARGELEITEAIWRLHESGKRVLVERVQGWWKDTGLPGDLLEANERVLHSLPASGFESRGTVEPGATVHGLVGLGTGTVVAAGCTVEGPSVLGRNVRLEEGARVGPFAALGDGAQVRGGSVRRSIVLDSARISGPIEVQDSIVGRGVVLEARSGEPRAVRLIVGDAAQIRL